MRPVKSSSSSRSAYKLRGREIGDSTFSPTSLFEETEVADMPGPFSGTGKTQSRRVPAKHVSRAAVLGAYGPSMKDAWMAKAMGNDSTFYDNRVADGFYGRGGYKKRKYSGRGMYTGRLEGQGLYGLAPAAMYAGGQAIDYAVKNPKATRKFFGTIGRKLRGRGEYEKSNELMASSTSSPPMFQSAGDEAGALIISHREYVGDIFAPPTATVDDFTVQSFPLNPGLEQTFPWLSQIAQNYEEYEMKQCVFEFVSTVQDINSTNGQVGTIISATQYNSSRPDFRDKPAMAAYAHSVSGKSTDNQTHGVECDPLKLSGSEGKYIRANPVMTGEDLKTYDHGRFQLATHNIPAAMASGTLGELYVTYTVCLRKPKFFTGRGLGLTRYLEVIDDGHGGVFTYNRPFGLDGNELTGKQNNLAVKSEKSNGSLKLTLPAYYGGRLRITLGIEGSSLVTSDPFPGYPTVAGNVSLVDDLFAGGSASSPAPGSKLTSVGGNGNQYVGVFSINVSPATNATDNSVTIPHVFTGGSVSQSYIDICEYNTFQSEGAPDLVNSAGTAVVLA